MYGAFGCLRLYPAVATIDGSRCRYPATIIGELQSGMVGGQITPDC